MTFRTELILTSFSVTVSIITIKLECLLLLGHVVLSTTLIDDFL